jgi:RNA polymerase sigma factor (sigma-70 family)
MTKKRGIFPIDGIADSILFSCNLFSKSLVKQNVKANEDSDIQLIERILRGETAAYRALVNRHKDYAFTIAFRLLNNREEAEEAAQDGFVRAFRGLASFNRDAKFTTWFYRVVVNAALTIQQKKKMPTEDLENAKILRDPQEQNMFKQKEQRYYIDLALKQLSPDDVVIITLFYLKEQSLDEIAEICNIEANSVKVKLHRARKRLAEVMLSLLKGEEKNLL